MNNRGRKLPYMQARVHHGTEGEGGALTFEEVNALLSPVGDVVSIMDPKERLALWNAAQEQPGSVAVEVGSAYGGTTALLALAGARPVFSVDNWACGQREVFEANLQKLGVSDQVERVVGDSTDMASRFADGSCWLVLVDGNHDAPWPALDIVAYAPKVMVGGYLFVDDTGTGHPDVHEAVRAWEETDKRFSPVFSHWQEGSGMKLRGWRRREA